MLRENQNAKKSQQEPARNSTMSASQEETLDIPTFLRNRNRRR